MPRLVKIHDDVPDDVLPFTPVVVVQRALFDSTADTGVYRILNMRNGKVYIGSAAKSFDSRWVNHKEKLRCGAHHNRHLQAAWNKYGESSFLFEIVERCVPELCIEREQDWLDYYATVDSKPLYNMCPTAGSALGRKLSDEQRAALIGRFKGRFVSVETRAKQSKVRKGRPITREVVERLRAANLGRKQTEETKKKISDANSGRQRSEETKKKISDIVKKQWAEKADRRLSDAHKTAIRLAWKRKKERAKISSDTRDVSGDDPTRGCDVSVDDV